MDLGKESEGRKTRRGLSLRAAASSPRLGETESAVAKQGAGATSVVGWSVCCLNDRREYWQHAVSVGGTQAKEFVRVCATEGSRNERERLSAAAKGNCGEPNNAGGGPPTKQVATEGSNLAGVSGERSSQHVERRKPIAELWSDCATEGVSTEEARTLLASPKAKPSLYRLASTKVKRKADDERRPLFRVGSGADTMRGARNEQPEEGTAERGERSAGGKLRSQS